MGNIVKYGAVNTKIKAMKGKFLTIDQYKKLLTASSFEDAIRLLKEDTSYKEILQGLSTENITRGQFEVILKRNLIKKLYNLSYYFSGEYKRLIKILFMKYEIEDLKIIIRSKYVQRSRDEIQAMLAFKNPFNIIDYDYLLSSRTVEELLERLKDTVYYKYIKGFKNEINNEGLFRMENNLDISYYGTLRKFVKKLNKEDRKVISDIVGFEADLLNITAIYRGRKYYNISSEVMYNYTIFDYFKLKPEIIKELCYSKTMDEYFDILKDLPYKQIIPMNHNEDFLIEVYERASFKKFLEGYMASAKLNISVVVSYFHLLHIEVQNIISIVEDKRYDAGNTELINFLNTSL